MSVESQERPAVVSQKIERSILGGMIRTSVDMQGRRDSDTGYVADVWIGPVSKPLTVGHQPDQSPDQSK